MAKATSTRREPARTATPEEIAEDRRRAEAARALALALKAAAFIDTHEEVPGPHLDDIDELRWAPTDFVEVAAVIKVIANTLVYQQERLDAIEGEGHWQPGLDGAEPDNVPTMADRLAALERRLDPEADYPRPDGLVVEGFLVSRPDDPEDDEMQSVDMLWANSHNEDGTRRPPKGKIEGEPMDDLANGHLRPQTWAQMCDCLAEIAQGAGSNLRAIMALEDSRRPMQELVANLSRAIAAQQARPARDVVEAYVLETAIALEAVHHKEAHDVLVMGRYLELYHDERFEEAGQLGFALVSKIGGELVANGQRYQRVSSDD